MILQTDVLNKSCEKILAAVDSNVLNSITETLEIKCENGVFSMAVTNREYYVNIKFDADTDEHIHATVDAILFLKLIGKVTSSTIELATDDTSLLIKCNGNYKLPLIYEDDHLLEIPEISMDTKTEEFSISGDVLNSIVDFNSKELGKGSITAPIQRLYYVDSSGCITFTTGACLNNFNIDTHAKLLMNDKIVRLFRLFKKDQTISASIGYKQFNESTTSMVIKLISDGVTISAILNSDDTLLQKYPVTAIRNRIKDEYPYSVSLNKNSIIQSIERLMLFVNKNNTNLDEYLIKLTFQKDSLSISDYKGTNIENVSYMNDVSFDSTYEAFIDSRDFTKTLQSCTGQLTQLYFGNNQAFLIKEGNINWVIPQCYES